MQVILILPWFDRVLNPNCIAHWRKKAAAKKLAREKGFTLVQALDTQPVITLGQKYSVHITFYPKTRRHFDLDNALAALKPWLDGICDGLGINDKDITEITLVKDALISCPETKGQIFVRLTN